MAYRRKSAKTKKLPHHAPLEVGAISSSTKPTSDISGSTRHENQATILFPEKRRDNVILRAKQLWRQQPSQKGKVAVSRLSSSLALTDMQQAGASQVIFNMKYRYIMFQKKLHNFFLNFQNLIKKHLEKFQVHSIIV